MHVDIIFAARSFSRKCLWYSGLWCCTIHFLLLFIFDLTMIHNNNGFTLSYLTPGGGVMKYTLIEELAENRSQIFSQWLLFRNGEYGKNQEAVKSFICFLGVKKFPNAGYCTNLLGKLFMDGLGWKMTLWLPPCLYGGVCLGDRWLDMGVCLYLILNYGEPKSLHRWRTFSVSSKLSDISAKYNHHYWTSTSFCFFFFFNDTATTEIYTLSLHDALPICHFLNQKILLCHFLNKLRCNYALNRIGSTKNILFP